MAPKKKNIFGGKSLSKLRKSIGLDKDKSKASTTKKERDKNLQYDFKKDAVKRISDPEADPITTAEGVAYSLDQGDFKPNFKAQETPSTFVNDLKDAYKSGLFTGGKKTKEFMNKYNLDPQDIVKLRTGIDQGLGVRMGSYGNVLTDIVRDLRNEGILSYSDTEGQVLYDKAQDIFRPGMTKYDREPVTGILGMAPLVNLGITGLDLIAGGSDRGLKGFYYGKKKGLTGDELENFAAAVANDEELFRQMMTTDEMQDYQIEKFRTDTIKEAMDKRQKDGDPDPISGTQPGVDDDEGTSTTDPGTDQNFIPQQQNFFTFFDPTTGRYRSGTYDEYLKYVTAKDGGIIQLSQGGDDEDPIAENKKVNLRNILAFIRENKDLREELKNMDTETKDQELVRKDSQRLLDEEDKTLAQMLKRRFSDLEGITGLTVGSPIRTAEEDQPAKDFLNIEIPPDQGPALREDLGPLGKVTDSGISLLMEALRKSDISTGSANQFIEEALNNFVAAGVIPPNTTYQQLTDPFKDLVTREAAKIAEAENMKQIQGKFNGGIIGLKKGGMNDMMDADSLMFKDPSDEGEWEYNV
tara:strand:+ start:1746 stop:3488 length:1743 start_codon:yes stop_codon:yes gene_type:complete